MDSFILFALKDIIIKDVALYIFELYLQELQFKIQECSYRNIALGYSALLAMSDIQYEYTTVEYTTVEYNTSILDTENGYDLINKYYNITTYICYLCELHNILSKISRRYPAMIFIKQDTLPLYVLKRIIEYNINCDIFICEVNTTSICIKHRHDITSIL